MSDDQLQAKFLLNAAEVIGEVKNQELARRVWEIDFCPDIDEIVGPL
jgi:hypothetical protein